MAAALIKPLKSSSNISDSVSYVSGIETPRGQLRRGSSVMALSHSPSRILADEFTKNLKIPVECSDELVQILTAMSLPPNTIDKLLKKAIAMQEFVTSFLEEQAGPNPDEDYKESGTSSPRKTPIRICASDMVHEVRTPLFNISMALEELQSDPSDPAATLRILRHSYTFLENVLNKISGKSESVSLVLHYKEPIILKKLSQTVQELTSQIAKRDGVEVILDLQGISEAEFVNMRLRGDFEKLSQILINLTSNAIKYSPKPGQVTIRIQMLEDEVENVKIRFEVQDQGKGISQEIQQNKLFKRYSQGDQATDTQVTASSGLGLYLSQQFAKLMEGEIQVISDPEDPTIIGTTFRLDLPFKKIELAPPVSPPLPMTSPTLPVRRIQFANPNIRILVADDAEVTRKLLKGAFKRGGCNVTEVCPNGESALQAIQNKDFDVCILDMNMGAGMNGWDTALKINALLREEHRDLPLIYFNTGITDGLEAQIKKHGTGDPAAAAKMSYFVKGTLATAIIGAINGYFADLAAAE